MTTRTRTAFLATGGLIAAATWAGGADVPTEAPPKLPAPVIDTHELMELFSGPLYEHLKADMAKQPADKKAWSHIRHHGYEAAEMANLIAIRNPQGEGYEAEAVKNWGKLSRDAQQAGLDLAHAAAANDWPKTQAAYKALVKNCNDCHQASGDDHAPEIEP